MYLQYYSTVQFCRTCAVNKNTRRSNHGHKKGHAPRALEGHSAMGISRPHTEVLRTRTYSSAANTLQRRARRHATINVVRS